MEQFCSRWKDLYDILYLGIFRKSVEKIQVSLKSDKSISISCEGQYTFLITSRSVLPRMRNASDKSCRENQNTRFMSNNVFFENRAVYEIMWKNIVVLGKPQITIWSMRIACWVPTATNTHSDNVTLISFPLKQWLHERP